MILFLLTFALAIGAQDVDYSQFVNPFIGSEGAIAGYACKYLAPGSALYMQF
jgi:hypothetical protein